MTPNSFIIFLDLISSLISLTGRNENDLAIALPRITAWLQIRNPDTFRRFVRLNWLAGWPHHDLYTPAPVRRLLFGNWEISARTDLVLVMRWIWVVLTGCCNICLLNTRTEIIQKPRDLFRVHACSCCKQQLTKSSVTLIEQLTARQPAAVFKHEKS